MIVAICVWRVVVAIAVVAVNVSRGVPLGERGPVGSGKGHRKQAEIMQRDDAGGLPPPPKHLRAHGKRRWVSVADSPLAAAVLDMHLLALERLCELYDERAGWQRMLLADPLSLGAAGQPVINPAAGELRRVEADIIRLEKEFGLTPMSSARLGLKIASAVSRAPQPRKPGSDESKTDPRLAAIQQSDSPRRRKAASKPRRARLPVDRG